MLGLQHLAHCPHSPSLDAGAVFGEWFFTAVEFSIYFITNKVVLGHMTVLISRESTPLFRLVASLFTHALLLLRVVPGFL